MTCKTCGYILNMISFDFHLDGLTIGAAFTQSITNGVGLSTAIILEEIPHQLGNVFSY